MVKFSGNAKIHLDTFLSVFNISGLPEEYYHNSMVPLIFLSWVIIIILKIIIIIQFFVCLFVADQLANNRDTFVDGSVIAAARTLPTWSDGDTPPIPSLEKKAVKELQEECKKMLSGFPSTSKQDQKTLGTNLKRPLCLEDNLI